LTYPQTQVIKDIAALVRKRAVGDGEPVDPDNLATMAPYITHTVRRFGHGMINLAPPPRYPLTGAESRITGAAVPCELV